MSQKLFSHTSCSIQQDTAICSPRMISVLEGINKERKTPHNSGYQSKLNDKNLSYQEHTQV